MKLSTKVLLTLSCVVLVPICVIALRIPPRGDDRGALDRESAYICELPGTTVYAAWGFAGMSKSCVGPDGKIAGTYMASEWGRVAFVENFDATRQHRLLEVRDEDGKVAKRVIDHR